MEKNSTDFKYILQDITKVYIGAHYTYQDMMDEDAIPFKFKAIISQYMLKEVHEDLTIAQHLMQMEETPLTKLVYQQLKLKIRVTNKVYRLEEFLVNLPQLKQQSNFFIQEIILTKLSIMSLNI